MIIGGLFTLDEVELGPKPTTEVLRDEEDDDLDEVELLPRPVTEVLRDEEEDVYRQMSVFIFRHTCWSRYKTEEKFLTRVDEELGPCPTTDVLREEEDDYQFVRIIYNKQIRVIVRN